MNDDDLFNAGTSSDIRPEGDAAREAVDSLRGYAYQVLVTALAWLDLEKNGRLFLEVAEDYATMAERALQAVQVKDTGRSESVTLNSRNIRDAITAFIDLVDRNPNVEVYFRYFTTSEIGTEKAHDDRPAGTAGLKYWRKVAAGADAAPLRTILESSNYPEAIQSFCKFRDDKALRDDLIKKIHWDCGKPSIAELRQELEERLIVIGRDRFRIPALEARRLADPLVLRVLQKSTVKETENRVLTRAMLYEAIDSATRVSVPRSNIDAAIRIVFGSTEHLGKSILPGTALSIEETDGFIDGDTLPIPEKLLPRACLKTKVEESLGQFGAVVITGGIGFGKSNAARMVARERADAFAMVDFRDADERETRRRLNAGFARIGGLASPLLILEDLNHIDDTQVTLSLSRVIEALRRRDRTALITCYSKPTAKTLSDAGLNQGCIVECPYFSEDDACALVSINGGASGTWGRLAYHAGGGGHPQLTHAFISGMGARNWPIGEIDNIIKQRLSSDDIDATRDAARRSLVSAFPEGTRDLLYRLSLTIGRFDRSLALVVGGISPPVSQAGERMDQLVGPWIESVGKDTFRVSPLARTFGSENLLPDEQKCIHENIARHMLGKGTIDPRDADTILTHALAGKSEYVLFALARSVLKAESRTLEMLAEYASLFRFIGRNAPLYPENPAVSVMLRLAQFKLAAAAGDGNVISDVAEALFDEINSVPEGQLRAGLEISALMTVLNTLGVANHLDNWITLLRRYRSIVGAGKFPQRLMAELDADDIYSLFDIGSANLASVDRLEHVINDLDQLDADERAFWLTPLDESSSDYAVFINGARVEQRHQNDFDAADAAVRYRRMAEKTRTWSIRPLTIQCWVAQAIMLDEYMHDKQGALAVLEDAVVAVGNDPILARAQAKIYWHAGEHETALEIFREIADQVGTNSPIERASALREAAISAAKCGDWLLADNWFFDAQSAAKLTSSDTMGVMAIGLGADSAVAALESGKVGVALMRFAEAVEALAGINAEATLPAAYCHRVVRHAILWAQSRIENKEINVDGAPIGMVPGACSNPVPVSAIRDRPLGHIDIAWYMLAQAEISAGIEAGIAVTLGDRLAQGPIPSLEAELRLATLQADIDKLNTTGFAAHFAPCLEAAVYLFNKSARQLPGSDPLAPERGEIPELSSRAPFDPVAEQVAIDSVLAFCIRSVISQEPKAMMELKNAINKRFAGSFPGSALFDSWSDKPTSPKDLDQTVIDIAKRHFQSEHVEPRDFLWAGLCFFEWSNRPDQPYFFQLPISRLAAWQRSGWKRIVAEESFRLSRPGETVLKITEALASSADDRIFLAGLLLAASEAVGFLLGSTHASRLKAIATGAETQVNAT